MMEKQKIINLNKQHNKAPQSAVSQKLINKSLKISTQESAEEQLKLTERYFHISIDKLAEAFEK